MNARRTRSVGRRRGGSAGAARGLEALEARVHLSFVGPRALWEVDDPTLTLTDSPAPVRLDEGPAPATPPADPAEAFPTPSSVPQGLMNVDDFRDDPRFGAYTGRGYSVAVLDSGINRSHPFFGPDANRNGVADRIVYSYDFADNDADATDRSGHGSNVSSIIASSDAEYGGIAPGLNLIVLKVFGDAGGAGTFGAVEKALRWVIGNATRYNIVAVNMSLGDGGNYQASQQLYGISDELASLARMDVAVVAAAGNDFAEFNSVEGLAYPAADPSVLAVGAVFDRDMGAVSWGAARAQRSGADMIAPFSQRSRSLWEVFAPGAPVTGAGAAASGPAPIRTMTGTSQAAPQVTGVVALVQQLAEQIRGRRLHLGELRSLLVRNGRGIVDGDDERDSVRNTGGQFRRIDLMAIARDLWDTAGPEIRVRSGTLAVVDGAGVVGYGTTLVGSSVVKTFTVENTGTSNLVISSLRVPAGFSLAQPLSVQDLAPGDSTTFAVQLDGGAVGDFRGQVRLVTNDSDERLFTFTVTGSARTTPVVLDDGSIGTRFTGAWTSTTGGYSGDVRTLEAGAGAASAEWSFTNLLPGLYRVWATWKPEPGLSRRAPFTLDGGGGRTEAVVVNQRRSPGEVIGGLRWEPLDDVSVVAPRLTVRLTGGGGAGRVSADAVRIERVGNLPGGAALSAAAGPVLLVDNDDRPQVFGTTTSGRPVVKTYILRNLGDRDVDLDPYPAVPDGFSLVTMPVMHLRAGTSTTFSVRMDAGAPGTFYGPLDFDSADGRATFRINLTGTVLPVTRVIDDGEPGFTATGAWTLAARTGYRSDQRSASGAGAAGATWTFNGLIPGLYRVTATWADPAAGGARRASNASYRIMSGATTLGTVEADQGAAPTDEHVLSAWWKRLGVFRAGASLSVVLDGFADGAIVADAVRIERVGN